jgi:hypothetical protein
MHDVIGLPRGVDDQRYIRAWWTGREFNADWGDLGVLRMKHYQQCPRNVVGKRCLIGGPKECTCQRVQYRFAIFDHCSTWPNEVTNERFIMYEPYNLDRHGEELDAFRGECAGLGIDVRVMPARYSEFTTAVVLSRATIPSPRRLPKATEKLIGHAKPSAE